MIRYALFAICLPVAALAEVWVDDPAACAGLDLSSESAAFDARGEDNMILFPEGMEAIEYYCEFDSPVILGDGAPDMQVRPGYCMEPGPFVYPEVFVIGAGFGAEGEMHVWSGANPGGEAMIFALCAAE